MLEWIESHPYLSGGMVLGAVVLWALVRNSQNSAAAATTAATTTASTGPDDTIQAQAIQAGVAVQTAQVSANAQTAQYSAALAAQQLSANSTDLQTITAGQVAIAQTNAAVKLGIVTARTTAQTSNQTTQAGLTLGLANGGQSTQSVLELLAAQPGANPQQFQWLIGGTNPSTAPSTTTQTTTTQTQMPAITGGVDEETDTLFIPYGTPGTSGFPVASGPVQVPYADQYQSPANSSVTFSGGGFLPVDATMAAVQKAYATPAPNPSQPFATGPGTTSDINQGINNLAAAAVASGQPSQIGATQVTNTYGSGLTTAGLQCPSGYTLMDGSCYSAAASPDAASDLYEQEVSAPWLPVDNLPDGSCPEGYMILNNACYLAATHGG